MQENETFTPVTGISDGKNPPLINQEATGKKKKVVNIFLQSVTDRSIGRSSPESEFTSSKRVQTCIQIILDQWSEFDYSSAVSPQVVLILLLLFRFSTFSFLTFTTRQTFTHSLKDLVHWASKLNFVSKEKIYKQNKQEGKFWIV